MIATIAIKRMRLRMKVRQGVSERILSRGVGHYPGTARPGRLGNTVLLGHRTTWLHPFGKLDHLRRGDRIVLKVGRRSYVYRVRGRHIIRPTDRRALEPVPFRPGKAPNGRYVTLISCTPKGSDRRRIVVVARMKPVVKKHRPVKKSTPVKTPVKAPVKTPVKNVAPVKPVPVQKYPPVDTGDADQQDGAAGKGPEE